MHEATVERKNSMPDLILHNFQLHDFMQVTAFIQNHIKQKKSTVNERQPVRCQLLNKSSTAVGQDWFTNHEHSLTQKKVEDVPSLYRDIIPIMRVCLDGLSAVQISS